MFIYLLVMALQVVQTGKPLGDLAYAIGMIAAMEVMVDWLKHAFVVKFNFIPPDIYAKFTTALCVDLAEPRGRRRGDSGHAMAIAARIGFVPIPLLCLLVKVLGTDVYGMTNLRHPSGWALCVLAWLCMCGHHPVFPPTPPPRGPPPPPQTPPPPPPTPLTPPRPYAAGARSRCSRRSSSSALRRSAPRAPPPPTRRLGWGATTAPPTSSWASTGTRSWASGSRRERRTGAFRVARVRARSSD